MTPVKRKAKTWRGNPDATNWPMLIAGAMLVVCIILFGVCEYSLRTSSTTLPSTPTSTSEQP